MATPALLLLLLLTPPRRVLGILTDGLLVGEQLSDGEGGARCARRLQRELDSLRRAATPRSGPGQQPMQATIDLAGYALHQPLRSAPYDMYVTGMRVRVPGQSGWVRVERCQFDARNRSLDTRLLFRDLTISGHIKLYEDAVQLVPAGTCTMTLRLRRAGLGFTAVPALALPPVAAASPPPPPLPPVLGRRRHGPAAVQAPLEVRTDARFVDPDFVSVYAHGCPAPSAPGPVVNLIEHRADHAPVAADASVEAPGLSHPADGAPRRWRTRGAHAQNREDGPRDLSGEMEDVFLRGIRTLLARYMERKLQPALRDAVMAGMGYSVSYGR